MFGYIDTWAEAKYAAPVIVDEVSTASEKSNYWQFVTRYLDETEKSFGYWSINGDPVGTSNEHQYGLLDSSWSRVN